MTGPCRSFPASRAANRPGWRVAGAALVALALAACSGAPPIPDWQLNAHGALERAVSAELDGNDRVAGVEWRRAREQTARTARADWLARVELTRCAVQGASLVLTPCPGFEPLAEDSAAAERAYARYLLGHWDAADALLLPPAHRALAQRLLSAGADPQASALLAQMPDPLARLVAAGVLMRRGQAGFDVIGQAVETASDQGWRRPLLAWLGAQALAAERAGDEALARQARRRMALLDPAQGNPLR